MLYQNYALAAVGCVISYFVITKIAAYVEAIRFSKAHGCQPIPLWPQAENIIGYGLYKEQVAARASKRLLEAGAERYRKMGNTFQAKIMGTDFITTKDPENIKALLATNFKDFGLGQRIESFGPMFGNGIFTSDGAHWEHSRALVRPNFARSQVADLNTFETHIQHLIQNIPRDGSTVDLQPYFFQLTFDSATEFLFGESVEILRSPEGSEQKKFATAFDYGQSELTTRSRLGPFMFLYRNPKFDEACKTVHNFVDKFVYRALEYRRVYDDGKQNGVETEERYVFLNELAKATKDPVQLRDELLNILLAGRDTTASLLSNTFHALSRRPNVWRKLRAEVDQLDGKAPDYETLRNMKYLKYVMNESLRLYPVVPLNARFANKNTTIPRGGGPDGNSPVFIPKGQAVGYSVYAMHRRTDIYGPDAEEFKPERWETLRVGWGYLPFNGGPRICVGQQFALTEAGYTIVRMMQEFETVEARDDRPWAEGLNLTLSSGNGVHVSLAPRK